MFAAEFDGESFENLLTFGKVMDQSRVSCFWTHGVYKIFFTKAYI